MMTPFLCAGIVVFAVVCFISWRTEVKSRVESERKHMNDRYEWHNQHTELKVDNAQLRAALFAEGKLGDVLKGHSDFLDKTLACEREMHAEQVRSIYNLYSENMKELANMRQFGNPAGPAAAQVMSPEPDADTRARRVVNEQTVRVGIARLRAEYESAGITNKTDDELEEEARIMINGISNLET